MVLSLFFPKTDPKTFFTLLYNTSKIRLLILGIVFLALEAEAYSEPSQRSKMELFAKIFNNIQPFTIFTRSSIFDV